MTSFKLSLEYNVPFEHEEYRQLSRYVYHQDNMPLPQGYKLLGVASNPDNGFYAEVVQKGNNLVIVTRGTEFQDYHDVIDNDVHMSKGETPPQYYSLMELYNKEIVPMKEREPNIKITFTGHSLGGTLSDLGAMTTGEGAVTFSSFGAEGLLPEGVKRKPANIINYGNEDDHIFASRIDKHAGDVRLVEWFDKKIYSHKVESWEFDKYIPYKKGNQPHITPEEIYEIKERRYFIKRIKEHMKENNEENISGCTGSYPVSGYTRGDGRIFGRVITSVAS